MIFASGLPSAQSVDAGLRCQQGLYHRERVDVSLPQLSCKVKRRHPVLKAAVSTESQARKLEKPPPVIAVPTLVLDWEHRAEAREY